MSEHSPRQALSHGLNTALLVSSESRIVRGYLKICRN